MIAGKSYSVPQASCSYSIDLATRPVPTGRWTGTVAVTTGNACAWSSTAPPAWITVTSAANPRTGSGSLDYTVAPNTTAAARAATLTVAGKAHAVKQANCTYGLSPASPVTPPSA